MTQALSEHVYLTPDRPMPDWMYQDANRRLLANAIGLTRG